MKKTHLFPAIIGVILLSSCGGGGSGGSPVPPPPAPDPQPDQTSQFSRVMAGKTWVSHFYTLNFSVSGEVDGTFNGNVQHYKRDVLGQIHSSSAQCVASFSGSFTFGGDSTVQVLKVKADSVTLTSATGPVVQLEPALLVCGEFLETLSQKSFNVSEYAADHMRASEVQDQADSSGGYSQVEVPSAQTVLGIDPDLFTQKDVPIDSTAQMLTELDGTLNALQSGKTKIVVDAAGRTLTVTDSACGLKYVIAVHDFSWVNGNSVIRGSIVSHNDGSKACASLKDTLNAVSQSGIVYGAVEANSTSCPAGQVKFYVLDAKGSYVYGFSKSNCSV